MHNRAWHVLDDDSGVCETSLFGENRSDSVTSQMDGIELAAWAGARAALKALLEGEYRVYEHDIDQRLLFWALFGGHEGIIELLSQHGLVDYSSAVSERINNEQVFYPVMNSKYILRGNSENHSSTYFEPS